MSNILYRALLDDVMDYLDNLYAAKTLPEWMRSKMEAPQRMSKAATEALLKFAAIADPENVSDLVDTVALATAGSPDRHVQAYRWPQTFVERADQGFLAPIIGGSEQDWSAALPLDSVRFRANSPFYGVHDPSFGISEARRRVYVPECTSAAGLIVRKPHNIAAPDEGLYKGVRISIEEAPSDPGTITLSDGTNELEIATPAAPASEVVKELVDAVNAEEAFFYHAIIDPDAEQGGAAILKHRYDVDLGVIFAPSIDAGTTQAIFVLEDIGTYELPVGTTYHNELVRMTRDELLLLARHMGQAPPPAPESGEEES